MKDADKMNEAVRVWGCEVVSFAIFMAETSDADGAVTQFEDAGMMEHAEVIRFMYWDE